MHFELRKSFLTSNWTMKIMKPLIHPKKFTAKGGTSQFFIALVILWFHLFGLFLVKIQIEALVNCGSNYYCKKSEILLIFWNICLFVMWHSLIWNRESVKNLFKEYRAFEDCHDERSFHLCTAGLNVATGVVFATFIAYLTACMVFFGMNEKLAINWYNSIHLPEVNLSMMKFLLFIHITFGRVIFLVFPVMLLLLHLSLYLPLILAISSREREVQKLTKQDLGIFTSKYMRIHKLAAAIESAISMETLFLNCVQFSLFFVWVSDLYAQTRDNDILHIISRAFYFIQPAFHLVTLFTAAEVNNQDISLRAKIKEKIFMMDFPIPTSINENILLRFLDTTPTISFTAWRMFSLTRSFILTSAGILLTYSVLILQIQPPTTLQNTVKAHLPGTESSGKLK